MKVAVVGAGQVGTTLGGVLAKTKHSVIYGVRSPEKIQQVVTSQPGTEADTVEVAVSKADAVILATPSFDTVEAIVSVAKSLGPDVAGKVVIDATNPLTAWPGLEVAWGRPEMMSGGEVLAAALPAAYVYKAFNTMGVDQLAAPDGHLVKGSPLTMLFAGPDDKKDIVDSMLSDMGFAPQHVGPIRYSRNLEAIAELWIHLNLGLGSVKLTSAPNFAFQLEQK